MLASGTLATVSGHLLRLRIISDKGQSEDSNAQPVMQRALVAVVETPAPVEMSTEHHTHSQPTMRVE